MDGDLPRRFALTAPAAGFSVRRRPETPETPTLDLEGLWPGGAEQKKRFESIRLPQGLRHASAAPEFHELSLQSQLPASEVRAERSLTGLGPPSPKCGATAPPDPHRAVGSAATVNPTASRLGSTNRRLQELSMRGESSNSLQSDICNKKRPCPFPVEEFKVFAHAMGNDRRLFLLRTVCTRSGA